MKIDPATLGVVVQVVSLIILLVGGVRAYTKLEEAVQYLKDTLKEHVAKDDVQFDKIAAAFKEMGGAITADAMNVADLKTRVGGLEETRREQRRTNGPLPPAS
jgi:phosphoribosyl-dephospho-CoA transferase